MSFDWGEFLQFAKGLNSDPMVPGPQEAALRSATSRAYYAAYHSALDVAKAEGFYPRSGGQDHYNVRKHFREHLPSKDRSKISTQLDRLYDLRLKADYDDSLDRQPTSLASHAIGIADRILNMLDSL